jgi:hypothetical protein
MVADEGEGLVERAGAQVIDLDVASHGDDFERAVEFAHGLVHEGGDNAAVDVAGWAFVHSSEMDLCGCDGGIGVGGIDGEGEVKALGVEGTAAEAVVGALVEGCVGKMGFGHDWPRELRIARNYRSLGITYCNDAGSIFFEFVGADVWDGFELRDGLRSEHDDVAQGGGAEDEELWEA